MSGKTQGAPHVRPRSGLVGQAPQPDAPANVAAAVIAKDPPHIVRCVNCIWGQDTSLDGRRRCRGGLPASHYKNYVAGREQIYATAMWGVVEDMDYCAVGKVISK